MPTEADYLRNRYQYSREDYTTSTPEGDVRAISYGPGYLPELLDLRARVESGQASPWEREWYGMQEQAARAIPMRDVSTLQYNAGDEAPDRLSGGSPDLANIMLTLQDKMRQGQATPQERALYETTERALRDQTWRASVPQPSDAFSPMGDNLLGALGIIGLGATGGLAAAPLAAGGASLATTLGSLGTLSGIAGTGAGVLGQALEQPWLSRLGTALGAAGGITGGVGGLANLWGAGVHSLGDAARLASNAGRVVGGVGSLSNNDVLRQAGGYLGMAGQLGGGVNTMANVLGGGVNSLTDAAQLARGLGQVAGVAGRVTGNRPTQQASQMLGLASTLGNLGGGVSGLLGAAQGAQRGATSPPARGVPFVNLDWLRRG